MIGRGCGNPANTSPAYYSVNPKNFLHLRVSFTNWSRDLNHRNQPSALKCCSCFCCFGLKFSCEYELKARPLGILISPKVLAATDTTNCTPATLVAWVPEDLVGFSVLVRGIKWKVFSRGFIRKPSRTTFILHSVEVQKLWWQPHLTFNDKSSGK